ncbi:MAG: hypothetical protein HYX75_09610 [Acidobacteria bacterium]|nr:hypothetical protein [Acidobacteriota bacterium]
MEPTNRSRRTSTPRFAPIAAVALIGCCLGGRTGFALDPEKAVTQYVHDIWSKENGLPHNTIEDIVQTPDGYIWIATLGGLVRFDGVKFTVFNAGNTKGFVNDRVTALAVTEDGSLWCGTEEGSLLRLEDGIFTNVGPLGDTVPIPVYALLPSRDGSLWVGTYGGGLRRLKDGKSSAYTTEEGLPNDIVLSLYEDAEGSLWAGTDGGGLVRIKGGEMSVYTRRNGLSSDYVYAICGDRDGSLWIGTYGGGLDRLRDGSVDVYRVKDGLSSEFISALYPDRDGNLWIGSYGGGLDRMRNGRFSSYTKKNGLSNNIVITFFEDAGGGLWIGTRGGLERLTGGAFTTYSTAEGMSDDTALAVYQDREGSMWVGTRGGLNRLKDGAFTTYTTANGLSIDTVAALSEDLSGNLWVGTSGGGLNRMRNGVFTTLTTKDGLPDDIIWTVMADRSNRVWIGTPSGLAVLENGSVRVYTAKDGLTNERVMALHEDRRGDLWIGTDGGGICILREGHFTSYTMKDGLSGDYVSTFYEDREGTLWIGTWGGGLSRFKDGRFTTCTLKQGLTQPIIHQVIEDDRGSFWIRGNESIARVDRKELEDCAAGSRENVKLVAYGRKDGIKREESDDAAYQPAAWKDRDGRLWFVTIEGVVSVNPDEIISNERPPTVYTENLIADHETFVPAKAMPLLVPPGTRRFEFHYTGLSPIGPEKIRFKFKLDGLDDDWTDAGTARVASYTHLPPGPYVFRVIACNSDGIWNREGASLSFRVLPYFFQTRWFYGGCGVFLLLLGPGIHLFRVRHLRARQKQLASQVEAAMSQIRVLKGLLPICASCKRIRDDAGYWNQMEVYVRDHSEAEFSHGICPDCMERLYPGYSGKNHDNSVDG